MDSCIHKPLFLRVVIGHDCPPHKNQKFSGRYPVYEPISFVFENAHTILTLLMGPRLVISCAWARISSARVIADSIQCSPSRSVFYCATQHDRHEALPSPALTVAP